PARVHFLRGREARIVIDVRVPAFGGDLADGIAPLSQQLPEGLRVGRAGEAAGQPHHGDRLALALARRDAYGRRGGRGADREDLLQDEPSLLHDRRVIEYEGGRERLAQGPGQPVTELHRQHRVHAEV